MTLFGDAFQICKHIFRQCVQLDPLTLQLVAALVQTRELDDVIDQLQKAARLAVDVGGELLHLFHRHQSGLHQLGKAGDGGQRRSQLVGNVGGEFAPQRLALLAFRHVHEQDDRADHAPAGHDGVGDDLPGDVFAGEQHLGVAAGERGLHDLQNVGIAADEPEAADGFAGVQPEHLHRAVVAGENIGLSVKQKEALTHVFRDGGEFPLAKAQLVHLAAAGVQQVLEPPDQRSQLLIRFVQRGIVEIDGVDRPCDLLGQTEGEDAAEDQNQHNDPQDRLEQEDGHGNDGFLRAGGAQDAFVRQPQGIIMCALEKGLRIARAAALAALQCLLNFLARQMIRKRGGVRRAVIEDTSVRRDQRHAVGDLKTPQKGRAGFVQRLRDAFRLGGQTLKRLLLVVAEHDGEEKNGADQQDRNADQKGIAEDPSGHALPPIL